MSAPTLVWFLINHTPCKAPPSSGLCRMSPTTPSCNSGTPGHFTPFHQRSQNGSNRPTINSQIKGIINVCTIKLAARVVCGQEEGWDRYKSPLSWRTLWRHQ